MKVTVIVPTLNDSAALKELVSDLRLQSRKPDSVIVVSGAHEAELNRLAREEGLVLIETTASRGLQLDTGARAAEGDILWFIHADARIPLHACESVVNAVDRGADGGCLRFILQGERSLHKRLLELLVRLRVACGGVAYGDQALFCTASEYKTSGGFLHSPLFEEVPLVKYLRNNRHFAALDVPVFVATRRWERDGWLRRCVHNRWLALQHAFGVPVEKLARHYEQQQSDIAEPQG